MATNSSPQTPFFGCKISLISKSEIRYEGILYTIDPKESTIALAKVRSFGSEDRPVDRFVPPRDDIFEFIIFRASDIKDLIVDDPPPAPNPALADPAIQSVNVQPSASFPSSFGQSSGTAPAAAPAPQPQQPQQQQHTALQQLQQQHASKGAIPKSQPSGEAHVDSSAKLAPKSSSNVAPGQAFAKVAAGLGAQQQKQPGQRTQQSAQLSKPAQPKPELAQQLSVGGGNVRLNQQPGAPGQQQPNGQQGQNGYISRQPRQNNNQQQQQPQQNRMMGENQNPNYQRNGGLQQQQNSQQGFRSYNANRFQPRQQQQGGLGGGFRGRGAGGFGQRNYGPRPLPHQTDPKMKLPEGEFDFEKSNLEFANLEEKLKELKVGEDGDLPEIPGIPASAITLASLEGESVGNDEEPCYNKTKSFFDSISCEALERQKGTNQRVDWKSERKMNRETFGAVSARRPTFFRMNNRGGFGGGGYHRGGGYHGGGGYHQQRGNHHHYQNRSGGPMNRVQRTPNSNQTNGVSSTTPNATNASRSGAPKTPNGVSSTGASIAIASKN